MAVKYNPFGTGTNSITTYVNGGYIYTNPQTISSTEIALAAIAMGLDKEQTKTLERMIHGGIYNHLTAEQVYEMLITSAYKIKQGIL